MGTTLDHNRLGASSFSNVTLEWTHSSTVKVMYRAVQTFLLNHNTNNNNNFEKYFQIQLFSSRHLLINILTLGGEEKNTRKAANGFSAVSIFSYLLVADRSPSSGVKTGEIDHQPLSYLVFRSQSSVLFTTKYRSHLFVFVLHLKMKILQLV